MKKFIVPAVIIALPLIGLSINLLSIGLLAIAKNQPIMVDYLIYTSSPAELYPNMRTPAGAEKKWRESYLCHFYGQIPDDFDEKGYKESHSDDIVWFSGRPGERSIESFSKAPPSPILFPKQKKGRTL